VSRQGLAALLVLALPVTALGAQSAAEGQVRTRARPGRAILVVMDGVIERLLPRFLEAPRDLSRRFSVKGGLVGLGAYSPPGGEGYGVMAPPLYLFPRAGVGQSLNVDPITGRSYFGWP
jgi:hypothetical protein